MKEPLILQELLGIIVCFAAVTVITTQGAKERRADKVNETNDCVWQVSPLLIVAICMLASWSGAIQAILNRKLKLVPTNVIIFYHGLLGFILFGCFILIEAAITGDGFRFADYTGRQFGILTCCTLIDYLSLVMMTMAFQYDSSGFVGLMSYMSIVYAYFSDYFLFQQTLNGISLIAALVIMFVAIGVAFYKLMLKRK